jgi:hypothetical protein
MESLEARFDEGFDRLTLRDEKDRGSIYKNMSYFLMMLKHKSTEHYQHSLRVALLATEIADYIGCDKTPLFISAALHDVGKVYIPDCVLMKKAGFSAQDFEIIKKHADYSRELIKNSFPFSSEIVERTHLFQEKLYPEVLPAPCKDYSQESIAEIWFYAGILSVPDCYDSMLIRDNDRFGKKPTNGEGKKIILKERPHHEKLITDLYQARVLV